MGQAVGKRNRVVSLAIIGAVVASCAVVTMTSQVALAATFTVNTVDDGSDAVPGDLTCETAPANGVCTLRAAIEESNANSGADVIGFNIAGAGPLRIDVFGALPPITEQITIDGYTQTGSSVNTAAPAAGSNAVIRVEIDGNAAMPTGLDLRGAPNSVVRGVSMFGFNNRAIDAGPGTTIIGSFIGLGSDGTTGYVAGTGIDVNGASGTRIGGPLAAERNIVAGIVTGIAVVGSDDVTIANNLIGLGPNGTQPSGPGLAMGVSVENATSGVVIGGGSGLGNVISASGTAVQIRTGSTNVAVKGNLIGLAPDGTTPRGNSDGIDVGSPGTELEFAL